MPLFTRIPQRFFTILTSAKKELYVEALFVLRQAFKTELVIRREELTEYSGPKWTTVRSKSTAIK